MACGGAPLPSETVDQHELSLVLHEELREVVSERGPGEAERVRIHNFSPMYAPLPPALGMPAIEMPPPAEVRIRVPDLGRGARLRFAAGVAAAGYFGKEREVRFEAEFRGRRVFERAVTARKGIPDAERGWHWADDLPVEGGGVLVLRTASSGTESEPTRCGFALLEVVVPREVRRTRSSRGRPNVVLVLVDTLRADRLHAYGGGKEITPALDRWATDGVLFERAYSASPWTVPSTTALLVGQLPIEQDVLVGDVPYLAEAHTTLAEQFRDAGLTTAAWMTNPLVGLARNFDQGFDFWDEPAGEMARSVMDRVEPWLRARAQQRWFLYLHLYDTHGPAEPEEDLRAELVGAEPPQYRSKLKSLTERLLRGEPHDERALAELRAHALEVYDAELAGVDRQMGRLRDLLEELGLADRTVIAFTSDHGEEFLEHAMQGHSKQLYDESIRVPLILAGPGVPSGRRVARPVENRALGATLLELAGIGPRGALAAPSLLSLEDRPEQPILLSTDLGSWRIALGDPPFEVLRKVDLFAAEQDGFRLHWTPGSGGWTAEAGLAPELHRLYDLSADPGETRDVKDRHPDEVARLHAWIENQLKRAYREARASEGFIHAMGYAGETGGGPETEDE